MAQATDLYYCLELGEREGAKSQASRADILLTFYSVITQCLCLSAPGTEMETFSVSPFSIGQCLIQIMSHGEPETKYVNLGGTRAPSTTQVQFPFFSA